MCVVRCTWSRAAVSCEGVMDSRCSESRKPKSTAPHAESSVMHFVQRPKTDVRLTNHRRSVLPHHTHKGRTPPRTRACPCVATHHGAHTRAASPHYSGPSAEKQPALRVASRVQSTVRRHMRRSCAHASPLSKVSLIVVCPLAAWPTPRAPCVLAAIICTHLESHRSHLVSPALAYYWRLCSYFFSPEASSFLTSS